MKEVEGRNNTKKTKTTKYTEKRRRTLSTTKSSNWLETHHPIRSCLSNLTTPVLSEIIFRPPEIVCVPIQLCGGFGERFALGEGLGLGLGSMVTYTIGTYLEDHSFSFSQEPSSWYRIRWVARLMFHLILPSSKSHRPSETQWTINIQLNCQA